jgi:DHA1 family multidrug resistance protein-like MFS transporter
MERFNVGVVTGTAGLSLYVLGYSFGPMLLAPLQELPKYGRNPIYMGSLFIYIGFVIASAVASNIETILVARFFAGFFGSPVLATGGELADRTNYVHEEGMRG